MIVESRLACSARSSRSWERCFGVSTPKRSWSVTAAP